MSTPQIIVRPAVAADMPALARVDLLAFASHPLLTSGFPSVPPSVQHALLLSRWTFHFTHNPSYHFLVAATTPGDEIAGFAVWKQYTIEKEPDWAPELPEGTNVEFMQQFFTEKARTEAEYDLKQFHVLEFLAVLPGFQRRGVGAKLMGAFVDDMEARGESDGGGGRGSFIVSSEEGKGLYEKCGWKVLKESVFDLKEWGAEAAWVSWVMKREVEG